MFCIFEKVGWRGSAGKIKKTLKGKNVGLNCLKNNHKFIDVFNGKKDKEEHLFGVFSWFIIGPGP